METVTFAGIASKFFGIVGEVVADAKRQELSSIELDQLRLKKTKLAEALEDFKKELIAASKKEQGEIEHDMVSRGLSNSTVRMSFIKAAENRAADELEKALREYNRAIEELALIERKLVTNSAPWWKKFSPTNRPRFSLRTLFVLVAIASLPMGWAAYQLNWIRQRHDFLALHADLKNGPPTPPGPPSKVPWALSIFGEKRVEWMAVFKADYDRAKELFPEASVAIWPDTKDLSPIGAASD